MSTWIWFLAALGLLLSAALVALSLHASTNAGRASRRRFDDLLRIGVNARDGWVLSAIERMGQRPTLRWIGASDQDEHVRWLRQAGWSGASQRFMFRMALVMTPFLGAVSAGACAAMSDAGGMQAAALVFVGFTLGFLAPRRILEYCAKRRQRAIAEEVPIATHLIRMLFDAGRATEQALRVLHTEGKTLIPGLAQELGNVLQRIDAGQDRTEALADLSEALDVAELTDLSAVLRQVTRFGGSVRESLLQFVQLMEDRQETALRERVGKLSAKMTVVMVVFLFPALMIFLAGPGFLALGQALLGAHG